MANLNIGAEIEYYNGKSWKKGVIHGIKKGETDGTEKVLGYLVDTGKDTRIDEVRIDKRDEILSDRVGKLLEKGVPHEEAVDRVLEQKDLPKSKIEVIKTRQPEQIEITPENIRLR